MKDFVTIFWFRRDLRLHDNAGLYHALSSGKPVIPLFIFDTNILGKLENKADIRVQFIHDTLLSLNKQLNELNSSLFVKFGKPVDIFTSLIAEFNIEKVIINEDYEPYGLQRDNSVKLLLYQHNIMFETFADHTIFGPDEVLKADGSPYTVFTPYSRRWKEAYAAKQSIHYDSETLLANFVSISNTIPSMEEIGFQETKYPIAGPVLAANCIIKYNETRDFPGKDSTTRNGIHLRFGTVSARKLVKIARNTNETYLNELIWREFFMQIIFHFPHVENECFHKKYNGLPWRNNEREFAAWCAGQTGYPLVDAGMRELNETGFMHNRVRMITAGFLTKHLLIDWRWGESYFASHLVDFELSSNNGNWQWAAGCGCDAAPYFRVFSPTEQQRKFDAELYYCKKWIPELMTSEYPLPIVDHVFARNRAISTYKEHLKTFAF